MTDLSKDALALRTGLFLNPKATLTMQNEKSRLSDRAAAAMDELVTAGLVTATAEGKAVTYRLTEAGQAMKPMSATWMEKHGRISLTQPIAAGEPGRPVPPHPSGGGQMVETRRQIPEAFDGEG